MNLVSKKHGNSPYYLCTWSTQNSAVSHNKAEDIDITQGYDGVQTGSMAGGFI